MIQNITNPDKTKLTENYLYDLYKFIKACFMHFWRRQWGKK